MSSSPQPIQRVTVTRKARFSSAHFYALDEWDDAKNQEVFYACSNRMGHGHNYLLEVAVNGPIDPDTGMVVNLKDLKTMIQEAVIAPLDHQNLNHQVAYFKNRVPTLENIAYYIWESLLPKVTALNLTLQWIRLDENDSLYVEYAGEKPLEAVS
jgi:6-pyruvoyltetrahydropterin/6-carboxytetrahydropterin synthase